MYCNWCGKSISSEAVYCEACGRAVRMVPAKRLVRPQQGRTIAGVALGVANYFDLDVTLVRLLWLLVAIFGGCGLLAYLVGWLVIPNEPKGLPAASIPVEQQQPQAS